MPSLPSITVYTDGSCLGNPGPGGWAAKLMYNSSVKTLSGGFILTTNNRMELCAAIMALDSLTKPCSVDLYTDSRYLHDAVEKKWLYGWIKRNWVKSDKKPVLNKDLWERLVPLLGKHTVRLHWVEAHVGHIHNEDVDTLAKEAAVRQPLAVDKGFPGAA